MAQRDDRSLSALLFVLPVLGLAAGCAARQTPVPWPMQERSRRDLGRGEALLLSSDYPSAEKALRRAVAEDPNDVRAQAALAEALIDEGRSAEAQRQARAALATGPDVARAHDAMCVVDTVLGDAAHAQAECTRAIAIDGKTAKYHHDEAMALASTDLAQALDEARAAVLSRDGVGVAAYQRDYGDLLRQAHQYEPAARHLRAAIALDPKDEQAYRDLGADLLGGGRIDAGLHDLEHAVGLDPSDAVAWDEEGIALVKEKQARQAVAAFRQAVQLSPGTALYHENLGVALRSLPGVGSCEQGSAEVDAAARLEPDDAGLVYEDAVAHDAAGDLHGAVDIARRLVTIPPAQARSMNLLGLLLEKSGDPADARKEYEAAVVADTACGECHYNLAHLLLEQGDSADALTQAQAAVADLPDDADAQALWGVMAYRSGDSATAEAQFRKALSLDRSKPVYYFDLGLALTKEDHEVEARKVLHEFLRRAPVGSPDLRVARTTLRLLDRSAPLH